MGKSLAVMKKMRANLKMKMCLMRLGISYSDIQICKIQLDEIRTRKNNIIR